MHSAESASLTEEYDQGDVARHDVRGGRDAFDNGVRVAPEDSRVDDRLRWSRSGASQRGSASATNRAVAKRPSIVKRALSATVRFVVAVLIGVGATLAWQAYGDQARARLATLDPSLAWLTPHAAAKKAPAAAAVSTADLAQQLRPIASEIAAMRQDLGQLATKQEQLATNQGQLAQGLSSLQAAQHELGVKVSAAAQPAKPKPVHPQPHQLAPRPLQPSPDEPDDH